MMNSSSHSGVTVEFSLVENDARDTLARLKDLRNRRYSLRPTRDDVRIRDLSLCEEHHGDGGEINLRARCVEE